MQRATVYDVIGGVHILTALKRRSVGGLLSYIPEYSGDELRDRPFITIMKADGPTRADDGLVRWAEARCGQ